MKDRKNKDEDMSLTLKVIDVKVIHFANVLCAFFFTVWSNKIFYACKA